MKIKKVLSILLSGCVVISTSVQSFASNWVMVNDPDYPMSIQKTPEKRNWCWAVCSETICGVSSRDACTEHSRVICDYDDATGEVLMLDYALGNRWIKMPLGEVCRDIKRV